MGQEDPLLVEQALVVIEKEFERPSKRANNFEDQTGSVKSQDGNQSSSVAAVEIEEEKKKKASTGDKQNKVNPKISEKKKGAKFDKGEKTSKKIIISPSPGELVAIRNSTSFFKPV